MCSGLGRGDREHTAEREELDPSRCDVLRSWDPTEGISMTDLRDDPTSIEARMQRVSRSLSRHDLEAADQWRETVAATGHGQYVSGSTLHTPDETNAESIRLAIRAGWRGATDQDYREIRRMLAVQAGDASLPYWHPSATDEGLSEALGWVADDAVSYLCDVLRPLDLLAEFDDGLWIRSTEDRERYP